MQRAGSTSSQARKQLTVVIPVHNEQDNLPTLVQRLSKVADGLTRWELEVLFVDDGSRDRSVQVIHDLRKRGYPVGLLQLSRNFGHQAALNAGLEAAAGDAVITMDSDLQHPPEQIPRMLAEHDAGADVVQMVRSDPTGGSKGLLSRTFYATFNKLSNTHIVPNAADFRLLGRNVVEALIRIPERDKFLRGLIPYLGFRQVSLEFDEAERLHGEPSFNFRSSLRLAKKALFDFSTVPLKFVFYLGMTMAVVSFAFGAGHVIVKLLNWESVTPGFTDIISAIFFLSGCVLASVGILGRYLIMILEEVRHRPTFVVREHLRGSTLSTPNSATAPSAASIPSTVSPERSSEPVPAGTDSVQLVKASS
jgi:dolichol-phosphate mannosyltransferase